ncbi:50S ribosomal protein L21 [bacterium CG2_30_33_46]|nr:MAG: 50S ribosomal protein L21 [bacterium CG2_30_33_46]
MSKKETFAVIKTGGKQYKIKDGQEIAIEKIEGKEGDKIIFSEVLLIAADNDIKLGTPFIKDAKVEGNIVSQEKGKKVIVFKMKAKKRYRRTAGHRQEISKVKIVKIIA